MKSCLFGVVRRCLRIIRLKPLFFLLFLFFSLIQLSISIRYLPAHICQQWVPNWSRALFTFSSFELRVERCSRDRTLPVRYAFIRWKRNISRAMFSRVSCVLFFSFFFFFFQAELLYAILRELGWIYGAWLEWLEKVW